MAGNVVCDSVKKGADVAQMVERVLGKDEVTGSIPVIGSIILFVIDKSVGGHHGEGKI